jgi:inorganic pyrophosphatase
MEMLDENLCKLLIAGILDNTLNLKASVTTDRDKIAYNKLLEIGKIEEAWSEKYFISCQELIEKDLEQAIINDMKIEYVSELLPKVFGQLLVYNKDSIINNMSLIKEVFNRYDKDWMLNLISLKEGKSYIFASSTAVINELETLFSNKFEGNVLVLDKFMLRKEIMKMARERK